MTDDLLVAAVQRAGVDARTRAAAVVSLRELADEPLQLRHSLDELAQAACATETDLHHEASRALHGVADTRPELLTPVLSGLLDGLQRDSPSPALRAAVNEVVELDHDLQALVDRTRMDDPVRRGRALQLLAYRSPIWIEDERTYSEVLAALARALTDDSDAVRYYAALAAYRNTRGYTRLLPFDTDYEMPRRELIEPLAEALVPALSAPQPCVRRLAAQTVPAYSFSLYRDGSELESKAIRGYISCFEDPDPVVRRVAVCTLSLGMLQYPINDAGLRGVALSTLESAYEDDDPRTRERAQSLVDRYDSVRTASSDQKKP